MRKVYLEGQLGEKFGSEWNLAVNSPAEALTAIMAQRPGMRQYLASAEGVQGYEILVDNESIDMKEELVLQNPNMQQSYSFVPVIGGSKSSGLMMILGVTLLAATGGLAGFGMGGFMGGVGAGGAAAGAGVTQASLAAAQAAGATVASVAATTGVGTTVAAASMTAATAGVTGTTLALTQGLGYLGTALMLGGAAMMLAPDVPEGTSAEKAENYLFSGPVNTVKQGTAIPLVYGRAIVGSKTISASVFTNTSRQKVTAGRKMVGIPNFRTDGSKSGTGSVTTSAPTGWGYGINVGMQF